MSGNLLRNWFVPKDGISREVISADIQRFLGNDATVRPGKEMINQKEVEGYWIRAYRNLTSEMINDLKVTTQKWDREQRSGTGRGRVTNYEDSHTFRSTNHGYGGHNIMTSGSPSVDGPGPGPFQPPTSRALPPQDMPGYQDPRSAYPAHSIPPGTSAYVDPPMYASHPRQPPQGYPPQPEYYPSSQPYHDAPQHVRNSPQYPGPQYGNGHNGQYGQPPPRDPRDDPRYQPDYPDPRYSYPPATPASNGAPIQSASQPISYPPQPRYDQYGRAPPIADPPYRPSTTMEPSYHARERPSGSGQQGPDARRRRIN